MALFYASNSATIDSANSGQVTDKPPNSCDIGWVFGKLISPNNYNDIQCSKCGNI